ncbi:MAG: hypothetical protein AAB444_00890 [Patescibacteria group bacterium]
MNVRSNFRQLTDASSPDPRWVQENRLRLFSVISADARAFQSSPSRARGELSFFEKSLGSVRFLSASYPRLATAFVAFVILFISSAGLASAAKASVPGTVLYPIKLALERTGLRMAPNAAMKTRLQIAFVGERMAEAGGATEPTMVKAALGQFQKQLEAVSRQVDPRQMSGTKPAEAAQIGNLLNKRTKEYKKQLSAAAKSLPESDSSAVAEIERAVNTSSLRGVELMAASVELGGAQKEEVRDAIKERLDDANQQMIQLSVKRTKRQVKRDKVGLAPVVAEEGEVWNAREALEEAQQRLNAEDLNGAVFKVKESVEIINQLPAE